MQSALRPYLSSGVAVVGAAVIAVVPAAGPDPWYLAAPSHVQQSAVALTADASDLWQPYVDLFNHTQANLAAIADNTAWTDILTAFFTNPSATLSNIPDVVALLTQIFPPVDLSVLPFPVNLDIELTPMLIQLIASLGPWVNMFNAMQDLSSQLFDFSDPWGMFTAWVTAPAVLMDAYLNGQDGLSLLGLDFPIFNGLLAPGGQSFDLQIGVGQIIDQLGIGDQDLGGLLSAFGVGDVSLEGLLTGLVDAAGLGHLTPTDLLDQMGLGDQTVASLLTNVLDQLGYGDLTPVGLLDQLGIGDQSVSSLAISLLDQLGVGNPSITDLVGMAGIGPDDTIAQLLNDLLATAGVGDPTITGLLEQLGMGELSVGGLLTDLIGNQTLSDLTSPLLGDMSVGDLVSTLLDAAGMGQQTVSEAALGMLNEMLGTTESTGLGTLLIDLLQNMDMDLTLNEAVATSGMGGTTLGTLVTTLGMADEKFKDLLPADIANQTLCALAGLSGLTCTIGAAVAGFGSNETLYQRLGNNSVLVTMQNVQTDHSGVSLADKTLADVVQATGMGDEHLSQVINNLGLNTTVGEILHNLGMDDQTVDSWLINSFNLDNTTLQSLLDDLGFNNLDVATVLDRLGLNDVNVVSLLSNWNLDNVNLSTVLDRLFGDVTVGSVLGNLNMDNVHLDDVLNSLLGGVNLNTLLGDIGLNDVTLNDTLTSLLGDLSVSGLLGDLGLNSVDLDGIIAGLGLGSTSLNDILGDLGLSGLTLDTLFDNLGLSGGNVLDLHLGDFSGLYSYLFNELPTQIAALLNP